MKSSITEKLVGAPVYGTMKKANIEAVMEDAANNP